MVQKNDFKNRVYGAIMVKAINANYNADFSGQPRTLPNGDIYSTDKATKYPIKNYIKDIYTDEKILYFKRFNPQKDDFIPFSLIEAFCSMFSNLAEISISGKKEKTQDATVATDENNKNETGEERETIKIKGTKKQIGQALLSCIDVRLFGTTFAAKGAKKEDNVAISVHGPVQINYGTNLWKEGQIYSAQIMSPFRNPGEDGSEDKHATTLGRQSRLDEGHYMHHFSVNPKNLKDIIEIAGKEQCEKLSDKDIEKLKEAMRRGVTWYDSASKAGCENEMLVWVQLKENSKIALPNFTTLIKLEDKKENGKCVYDFAGLKTELGRFKDEINTIEVYYNKQTCSVKNLPESTTEIDL
jgi:CRISPR-associated protein Csh2